MASYRHLARIAVMQTVFAHEFHYKDADKMLEYVLKEFGDKIGEADFAKELLYFVLDNKDAIIEMIQKYAPEWPIDKIAPIDRAILELGAAEIAYSTKVPPVVAINEAIEIAKSFGDTNSPRFINGVLSSIMSEFCKKMDVKKSREDQAA